VLKQDDGDEPRRQSSEDTVSVLTNASNDPSNTMITGTAMSSALESIVRPSLPFVVPPNISSSVG
jgi:hypothetical protein